MAVTLGPRTYTVRNIHGVASTAALDGDEPEYRLGRVAEIKRRK